MTQAAADGLASDATAKFTCRQLGRSAHRSMLFAGFHFVLLVTGSRPRVYIRRRFGSDALVLCRVRTKMNERRVDEHDAGNGN